MGFSSGHISNVEHGHVVPSSDLLEVYINLGGDRGTLGTLLAEVQRASAARRAALRRAQRSVSSTAAQPAAITVSTRRDEVRPHYAVEDYTMHMRLDARGAIQSIGLSVVLRALSPNVRFYFTGHALESDRKPGSLSFIPENGGRLAQINENGLGAVDAYFELDRVLQPDSEPHRLSYSVHVNSSIRVDPQIEYYPPPNAHRHTLVVSFTEPAEPGQIWHFAVSDTEAINHPNAQAYFERAPDDMYMYTFEPLQSGWCYGFAWTWPGDAKFQ